MKIEPNTGPSPVARATSKPAAPPPGSAGADKATFTASVTLTSALQQVPDVRAEEVARAKQLVDDPHYPPLEIIRKLSILLGIRPKIDDQ